LVFEGLQVAFGEGIVVGGVRAVVGPGYAEIGEQERGGLGLHRAAAVGMQGELTRRDGVLGDGIIEQRAEQRGALGIGDTSPDDTAAEDVEDDREVDVAPLGWPHQLGAVPGPDGTGRSASSSGFW